MPKAIIVKQTGAPSVMKLGNIAACKAPKPGQAIVRHTTIGVNYIDIYYRSGLYKSPRLPIIPGIEACGVVEAVGEGVDIPVGQRVVYATALNGSYCEQRLINANLLVGVPDFISDEQAAAIFAKGLTAHYLLYRTYNVSKKDTILVHSAAGATGQVICQWAKKAIGATVIGTVGSTEKEKIARKAGCDHVIVYTKEDFAKAVNEITANEGVNVVYDGVGKDTFQNSLKCLRPLGLMVSYGQSSGNVPPFNVLQLASKGIFLTRPTLNLYKADRKELLLTAIEIFRLIEDKKININIGLKLPLADAVKAHNAIQSRETTGSVILTV